MISYLCIMIILLLQENMVLKLFSLFKCLLMMEPMEQMGIRWIFIMDPTVGLLPVVMGGINLLLTWLMLSKRIQILVCLYWMIILKLLLSTIKVYLLQILLHPMKGLSIHVWIGMWEDVAYLIEIGESFLGKLGSAISQLLGLMLPLKILQHRQMLKLKDREVEEEQVIP